MNATKAFKKRYFLFFALALSLAFVVYCAINAYTLIKNSRVFNQKTQVNLELRNYEIQEIDQASGRLKWSLEASSADADVNEKLATIINPKLHYHGLNSRAFEIQASQALLDKSNKRIELIGSVKLNTQDGVYHLEAGKLIFEDSNPNIVLQGQWSMTSTKGFFISGENGLVKKDFKSLVSQGNSKLIRSKDSKNINITGSEIFIETESTKPILAQGNARLEINPQENLNANTIIISEDGNIEAMNNVHVLSAKLECFSNKLLIKPNPNKSPKLAIFSGAPHIKQANNMIYADSIIYDFETKQANIEGNVHSE